MLQTPESSRRKRDWLDDDMIGTGLLVDDGEQDENSVRWVEDQRLRRRMQQATEDISIPLPEPTQRSDLRSPVKHTQFTSTAGSSSFRPSRKRVRRHHQSLPLPNASSSTFGAGAGGPGEQSQCSAGPSSAPQMDRHELDDLLDRAIRTFSIRSPSIKGKGTDPGSQPSSITRATAQIGSSFSGLPGRKPLGNQSVNSPVNHRSTITKDNGSTKRDDGVFKTPSLPHTTSNESVGLSSSSSTLSAHSNIVTPCGSISNRTSATHSTIAQSPSRRSTNTIPGGCSQNTTAPRIGLRSTTSSSISTTAPMSKPFRAPTLQSAPIRSSPRRAVPPKRYDPSASPRSSKTLPPIRAAGIVTTRPPATRNTETIPRPSDVAESGMNRGSSPDVDAKMPSSDGAGNESFDSFDGMLAEGGDEVEALLRAIDAGKA